ncbi:DUF4411 family protein [Entomomonas moraniae]|uniref:DUF4411 family protein n=1 Tax=Entomomonas moraniae TaxID=2213226 RepID=A0A3Q9JME2_9GAMM|nr:DUF4411 family protein [Entomomonas moraniae]AZS50676.1 DUF4411 family protein [Entomomonas moraniae]
MYLIDSNIFIDAQNNYYRRQFCPAFWDFIDAQFEKGHFRSIISVYIELQKQDDNVAEWIKNRKSYFLPIDDETTQINFAAINSYVEDYYLPINPDRARKQINKFADGADPFLIAKALTLGAKIITHEKYIKDPKCFTPKIPTICKEFNVECVNLFDFLNNSENLFILNK